MSAYEEKIPMHILNDAHRACSPLMKKADCDWIKVMNDWKDVLERRPHAEHDPDPVHDARLNTVEESLLQDRLPAFTKKVVYESPVKCLYVVRPPTLKRKRKLAISNNRKIAQAVRPPKKLRARALAFQKPN